MSLFTYLMLASLVGGGTYLILSRRYSEVVLGLGLLSNAVNLLLISTSHTVSSNADPLPQALILTAIVIGFALITFFSAFVLTRFRQNASDAIADSNEEPVS